MLIAETDVLATIQTRGGIASVTATLEPAERGTVGLHWTLRVDGVDAMTGEFAELYDCLLSATELWASRDWHFTPTTAGEAVLFRS